MRLVAQLLPGVDWLGLVLVAAFAGDYLLSPGFLSSFLSSFFGVSLSGGGGVIVLAGSPFDFTSVLLVPSPDLSSVDCEPPLPPVVVFVGSLQPTAHRNADTAN